MEASEMQGEPKGRGGWRIGAGAALIAAVTAVLFSWVPVFGLLFSGVVLFFVLRAPQGGLRRLGLAVGTFATVIALASTAFVGAKWVRGWNGEEKLQRESAEMKKELEGFQAEMQEMMDEEPSEAAGQAPAPANEPSRN